MEKFKEGEAVIYQNGGRFEIGVVKSVIDHQDYFINFHTGDTAALTSARNLHKIANLYAFRIDRRDTYGNVIAEKGSEKNE